MKLKIWLGDIFYGKELDQAYTNGLQQGSSRALSMVKLKIENRAKWLTPAKQSGTDFALEVVEEVKELWKAL
jgi:hypothetical protein